MPGFFKSTSSINIGIKRGIGIAIKVAITANI